MAVPKKRTPKSKKGMRRSHHGRTAVKFSVCPNCNAKVLPHRACATCGMYRGRKIVDVTAHVERAEKKRKEKARKTGE